MKNFFKKYISQYQEKKRFEYFLKNETDISLKDNLNKLSKEIHTTRLRILGNGSSLNNDLDSLESEKADFMVVNRHVLSDSFTFLKPKYYVIVDSHFFSNEEGLSILRKIVAYTTWQMFVLVPNKFQSSFINNLFAENNNIRLTYFNSNAYYGPENKRNYCYDHNLAMPSMENVVVAAIYIGISMNCQKIELYGVEHDWTKNIFVDEKNQVRLLNKHFFDKTEVDSTIMKKHNGDHYKMHEPLRMYARMFESYWELEEIAVKYGITIINRTKDSFIDAFKRSIE